MTPPRRTLYVLPSIPDDLPPSVKNALALRNACAIDGVCPLCGATGESDRVSGDVYRLTFRHEQWCQVPTGAA